MGASSPSSEAAAENNKLLTADEYRLIVLRSIAEGCSWKQILEKLFSDKSRQHPVVLHAVRDFYVETLSEFVTNDVLDNITELCCSRNQEFLSRVKEVELEQQQLINLDAVLKDEPRRRKQIVAKFHRLLNELVPHFSSEKVEKELLRVIVSWFKSGEMTLSHFLTWHNSLAKQKEVHLSDLKNAKWTLTNTEDTFFDRFQVALNEIPTKDLSTENRNQLKEFLTGVITTGTTLQETNGKRHRMLSKLFYLSSYKSHLEDKLSKDKSISEINLYAEYAIIVDCSLSNEKWHGINLSLVAEKIIIKGKCEINLSGLNHRRDIRGKARSGRNRGEKGENGSDGIAGESSGNIFLCANEVKNPGNLKVILNGGDGEGGQDGGEGVDGLHGRKNTKDDLNSLLPKYESLYLCDWTVFSNYDPGKGWTKTFGEGRYKGFEEWIERTYKCDDGREMDFAIAGMRKLLCTVYDFRFVLRGGKGSMGSEGGANGVGGEGGNRGVFTARRISTADRITGIDVEMKRGNDGVDGKCGRPGDPGSNGNDVAFIDQSGGWNGFGRDDDLWKYGLSSEQSLSYTYHYESEKYTRLSGYRMYKLGKKDCFVGISTTSVDKIQSTKSTEKRCTSDRQRRSQAVSKQNISVDMVLGEYMTQCVGEEVDIDYNKNAEFSVHVVQETEEEQRAKEQITVVKVHVDDEKTRYYKKEQKKTIEPEKVVKRVHSAVNLGTSNTLEDLISLWNDVFSAPIDVSGIIEQNLDKLAEQTNNIEQNRLAFENRSRLRNGMTRDDVQEFANGLISRLKEKKLLSSLPEDESVPVEDVFDLSLKREGAELIDVRPVPLDDFWSTVDSLADGFRKQEIDKLFNQLEYKSASTALLIALHKINEYLSKYDKIFENYKKANLNWCNVNEAKAFLRTFVSSEERNKLLDDDRVAEDQAKDSVEHLPSEDDASKQNEKKESKWVNFTDSVSNFLKSYRDESFKDVAELMKKHMKEIISTFESFAQLLNHNPQLYDRFSIEKSTVRQQPSVPGSTPMSLVHMYFVSQQILEYNMKLFRYYQVYEKNILTPRDWFNDDEDIILTIEDFTSLLSKKGMPTNLTDMKKFMLRNGIKCAAYRLFIADQQNVNVQVFCHSGYSKMRLVENLNPFVDKVRMLYISKTGKVSSISADLVIRKLRRSLESRRLNIPVPTSNGELDLTPYFSDKYIVEEWSRAMDVTSGPKFLRFLQKIFSLRGCSFSIPEFQFMLNTVIDVICNFNVSTDNLVSCVLSKDGIIHDLWLAIRLIAAMRENSPKFKALVADVAVIQEPMLRTLFGSKLHEIELDQPTLRNLIDMLSHAEDRVAQLEKISLSEWVDIAKCQTWVSYAPLLKEYGTVGYFFVFLNSLGQSEGEHLRRLIDRIARNGEVMIFEKVISLISYMIAYKELELSEESVEDVKRLLESASLLASSTLIKDRLNFASLVQSGYAQKFGNIYLLTNEAMQLAWMKEVMKSPVWTRVFPSNDRTLSDVVRLTINPQDDEKQKESRRAALNEIEGLLKNTGTKDPHLIILKQIDEVLLKKRKIRLRDTQKIAVLSAVKNKKNLLSQVNTGEGKSYIIVALAIMRIRTGDEKETVDIITSSSVLAQRDAESMRDIYKEFGITVSHNCDEDMEKRKNAYSCRVVYGDITRFERDHLLHNFYKRNILGSRVRCNVIIDEVDSMLLDNGSNMLYLSHNIPGLEQLESLFLFIHKQIYMPAFNAEDEENFNSQELRKKVLMDMCGLITKKDVAGLLYDEKKTSDIGVIWRLLLKNHIIDEEGLLLSPTLNNIKELAVELKTECGVTLAGRVLAMLTIVRNRTREITVPGYLRDFALFHLDEFIENAKKALFLKHNDEYVVDVDHTGRSGDLQPLVTIIDKGTGTDLSTSQWSEGLHQFLQLKHGCRLSPLSLKAVFISNVSYLKGYVRLNGYSGTLGSKEESSSLVTLYDADLVRIPTWKAKTFNENAPVLATTTEEWIKEIYDETCDQVLASRSVLIICQSIAEVENLYKGLSNLYTQEPKPRQTNLKDTFDNIVVYKREFDEFDFSNTGGLMCSRLIISTNLAGRGTDIILTKQLASAGGLHIIVSFLPENSRIEDQAYGRSARCGQPGSGQIITLVENENATNIFQLKQFRDNAEVHRLRSLKQFYDYHIEVEETCLTLFKDFCSGVLSSVYSHSEDTLPTLLQTVYFALLDEWAMWLDRKTEAIKKCEQNKSNQEKEQIIESVKEFLKDHPLPEVRKTAADAKPNVQKAFTWITCPQPFLASALIDIANGELSSASQTLDKVLEDFPEFAAEAYYYKGVVKQQQIRQIKTTVLRKIVSVGYAPERIIENDEEMLKQATICLLNARGLFTARAQQKNLMSSIVCTLQQNPCIVKSRGFAVQQEEAVAVLETFVGHIDDILGHTVKPDDVRLYGEPPSMHVRRFREFRRAGIFSPTTLSRSYTRMQLDMISYNHGISVPMLSSALHTLNNSADIDEHDGFKVITADVLAEAFSMPSVTGFWDSLRRAGCFLRENVYVAVKKSQFSHVNVVKSLTPVTLKRTPFLIQLSENNLDECNLYDVGGAARELREDDVKNHELQECLEVGTATIEVVAEINPLVLHSIEHLDQFDFLTKEMLMRELAVSPTEAAWILEKLVERNILLRRIAKVECETEEKDENENLVFERDESDEDETNTSGKEMDENDNSGEEVVYLLVEKINCDMFPENIRSILERLLTKQFCYGYALKSLRSSVREAISGKNVVHRILLPSKPYSDLHANLLACGILNHERLTRLLTDVYSPDTHFFSKDDHFIDKVIYDRLQSKAPWILINKCKLVSTVTYLKEKGILPGQEMRKIICGGMRQVAVITKPNPWIWALGLFVVLACVAVAIFLGPVALAIGLCALAPVGTTLFVLAAMGANQKIHSTIDEFKILRDFHEVAIAQKEKEARDNVLIKEVRHISNLFVQCIAEKARFACNLTDSDEDVADLKNVVNSCCEKSEHLPLLKAGIRRWFTSNAFSMQLSHYGFVFEEGPLPNPPTRLDPPKVLFAFGSLLIAEINSTLRGMDRKKTKQLGRVIKKRLEYNEFMDIQNSKNEDKGAEKSERSLRKVLRDALREAVDPIVEECIRDILQPAMNKVESVKRERKDAKIEAVDEKLIAKKKIIYDKERRTKNNSTDFLATDLHNIFLRICFREARPEIIQHMVHYNYPLSAHCATSVFNGVVEMLKSLNVKTLLINLKRDNETIFSYSATSIANSGIEVGIVLGLQRSCFYVYGRGKAETQMKHHLGLFEALCEAIRGFSDAFALGPESFIQKLEEIIGNSSGVGSTWVSEAKWHSNEKLVCPV
ncbi:hypothetical protein NECAME_08804 [Necator americanus]|uniref:Uncharacterized protein n=1 Tax=Necator americanus TaxID=51031 RepID=W2TJ00_NECAM|nr:hypothetical protein NECAME_08804 [Necator americanus]ETN81002.1 hypothetical protein NECAME_08804 [Necator americanus]